MGDFCKSVLESEASKVLHGSILISKDWINLCSRSWLTLVTGIMYMSRPAQNLKYWDICRQLSDENFDTIEFKYKPGSVLWYLSHHSQVSLWLRRISSLSHRILTEIWLVKNNKILWENALLLIIVSHSTWKTSSSFFLFANFSSVVLIVVTQSVSWGTATRHRSVYL